MPIARAVLAALAAVLLVPAAAAAGPGSRAKAVVTLGDSYISGEAGRWQGNSISPAPGADGTDRGRAVYGATDASGCHRSDLAPVLSAALPGFERVNLACSGGATKNVFRASSGGVAAKGEAPQTDQLLEVARRRDVELVLVSIGGNDLGFARIVTACFAAYAQKTGPCVDEQQRVLDAAIPDAQAGVEKAIDEIRAVMAQAGYRARDYRLVLQTYPIVIPRAAEARFAEADQRRTTNGCPFYDRDLDWARDAAGPAIGRMVKRAARARGAEWLDLIDLFQGHEVCSVSSRQSTAGERPPASAAEWGRMLSPSSIAQGERQELFHPNAFGQQAIGACLTQLHRASRPGTFACSGAGGIAPAAVTLRRLSTLPAPLRLRVVRTFRRGERTCARVRVTSGGAPVRRARVRFAGAKRRTDARGRATVCGRPRSARPRARATKRGFKAAHRVVRRR